MKNTSRKPYIYKVTNFETGRYYIGSQCRGLTIGVNYFTSSTNKEFWEEFKTYRDEKYKIEIIKEFEDPDECGRAENYMIRDHMLLKDGLCVNKFYCCNGKKIFSRVGVHLAEKTKQKLREANKGHSPWNKGGHLSEETKKKISEAKKGLPGWNKGGHLSEETKIKISGALKGVHLPTETRQKMSRAQKGRHHSDETKQKIGKANKDHPSPRRIKISIGDSIFNSIMEAAKYYNVCKATIRYWAKTKKHNAVYIEK